MPLVRADALPSTTTTVTVAPTTTITDPPTTVAATAPPTAPPTTRAPRVPVTRATTPPVAAAIAPLVRPITGGLAPYRGLGTWADVYDWSRSYTNNKPGMGVSDIDRMASVGVQTLYIQAAFWDAPTDVVDQDLLMTLLDRAHQRGIQVIAWYLPTLADPNHDLRRMVAMAQLPVEGVAVDIESRKVADVADRNQRLVAFSSALRQSLPGRTIGGIVLPPVVMEVVNTNYWPNFPWTGIAPYYDVWLPMSYWTNRTQASGYKEGYRYTAENIARLRNNLRLPQALVHTIGGIGDKSTSADIDGMARGAVEYTAVGGSIYDWRTTGADLWPYLGRFRA
jgi:hypothetical protein